MTTTTIKRCRYCDRFPNTSPEQCEAHQSVTTRPWYGPDAVTGLTMLEFRERLEGVEQPAEITRAAVSICRSYGIAGLADVGYIANTIGAEVGHVFEKLRDELEYNCQQLEQTHYKCNVDQDEDCYAEQYGDGVPDQHATIRQLRTKLANLSG